MKDQIAFGSDAKNRFRDPNIICILACTHGLFNQDRTSGLLAFKLVRNQMPALLGQRLAKHRRKLWNLFFSVFKGQTAQSKVGLCAWMNFNTLLQIVE